MEGQTVIVLIGLIAWIGWIIVPRIYRHFRPYRMNEAERMQARMLAGLPPVNPDGHAAWPITEADYYTEQVRRITHDAILADLDAAIAADDQIGAVVLAEELIAAHRRAEQTMRPDRVHA